MPGFDGTGPRGQGPMTGGGRGYCAVPLSGDRPIYSGRRLFGKGQGRGWRNCFYATGLPGWMRVQRGMQAFGSFGRAISEDDELAVLKNQADFLKEELDTIQTRVQALEGQQGAGDK